MVDNPLTNPIRGFINGEFIMAKVKANRAIVKQVKPAKDTSNRAKKPRQNTSDAVMAQRASPVDSLDDFPTPPWATRALCRYVIKPAPGESVLEPACGRGYMAAALKEFFPKVMSADIFNYGYSSRIEDFLQSNHRPQSYDWVITNPPFNLAEQFIDKAIPIARRGVAILTRLNFLDTQGRFIRLFDICPPDIIAQFADRVPMVVGRLDRKASTATAYCWLIWTHHHSEGGTKFMWIPPCRSELETDQDYDQEPVTWKIRRYKEAA
jgi:hypothetical protein